MKRLLREDPDELRGKYLYDFSRFCRLGPNEVDVLRYVDFIRLILHIEAEKKAMQKKMEVKV